MDRGTKISTCVSLGDSTWSRLTTATIGIYQQSALAYDRRMALESRQSVSWAAFAAALGLKEDEAKAFALTPLVIAVFAVLFFRINGCGEGLEPNNSLAAVSGQVTALADSDGDGVFDETDRCVNVPAATASGCPSDADGDGVLDTVDRCPTDFGRGADGCAPDEDGDGVPDEVDRCPSRAAPTESGCPSDRDGDGVYDPDDRCPDAEGDDDGCPPDSDGDGVPDAIDECPKREGLMANAGCPEVVLTAPEQELLELAVKHVEFETASATLTQASAELVDQVAALLQARPELQLTVEGHTDNQGDPERNLALSRRRAESCASRIVSNGVLRDRVKTAGFGQSRPIAPNDTPANRRKNRRVEFQIR